MANLKQQLLTESNGSTIELMLVNQAISTWIQLHYYENQEALDTSDNIRVAEYRSKRVENAFKRHLKSLGSLASVKVLLPVDTTAAPAPVSEPTDHSKLVTTGEPQKSLESTTRSVTSRLIHLHQKVRISWFHLSGGRLDATSTGA